MRQMAGQPGAATVMHGCQVGGAIAGVEGLGPGDGSSSGQLE